MDFPPVGIRRNSHFKMQFPAKMSLPKKENPVTQKKYAPKKKTANYSGIATEIHRGLARLREDEVCTDFEVKVGDSSFLCHKAVLASVSDYFRAMFTSGMKESQQNETTFDNISPEAFKVILDLLYYKESDPDPLVDRSDDELCELLRVLDMFQIATLSKLCLEYLGNTMSYSNCVQRWKASTESGSDELKKMSWDYLVNNFEKVAKEGFLSSLEFPDFFSIIKTKEINVSNEFNVWLAISAWIDFDETNRSKEFADLMKQVSLTEIAYEDLAEEVAFNEKVQSNKAVAKMVQSAIRFKNHPGNHSNMDFSFRKSTGKEQVCILLGNQEGSPDTIMLYYSEEGRWKSRTYPELQVSHFAACLHGQDIFVSGGVTAARRISEAMYKLSRDLRHFDKCGGNMTIPLSRHAMVATDSCLYAVGGRHKYGTSGAVLQFCLRTERWEEHGEIIAPVEQVSAVCLKNRIYINGGILSAEDPEQVADSIQVYDIATKTASILCHLPSPCSFSCCTARLDQIFIVTANGEVIRLSGKTLDTMTTLTPIPDFKKKKGFGMHMKGELIMVCGGSTDIDMDQEQLCKTFYVHLAHEKVWNGKPLPKACTWYGSLNAVITTDTDAVME